MPVICSIISVLNFFNIISVLKDRLLQECIQSISRTMRNRNISFKEDSIYRNTAVGAAMYSDKNNVGLSIVFP